MTISTQITEEAHRFQSFFGHKPDYVFLGYDQLAEIDALVAEMSRFGLLVPAANMPKRPKLDGMEIFRVDAQSHLSFGVAQPSLCG